MNTESIFNDGLASPQIAIVITVVLLGIYQLLNKFKGNLIGGNPGGIYHFLIQKTSGFLMLGAIPFYFISHKGGYIPSYLHVDAEGYRTINLYMIGLGICFIGVTSVLSKKEEHFKVYPEIRALKWTEITALISGLGSVVYMIGYEFLFRGFLLLSMLENDLHIFAGIAASAGLSALAHSYKGKKAMLGSFIVGLVLSIVVIKTGIVWIAIVGHILIAWSNDYFSFKENPETSFSFFSSEK